MASFRLPADDLEYTVLRQLWELNVASVRELHERLGRKEGLVYTTIAKVVDRLREKGLIQRQRKGQAYVYTARIAPEEVERARARAAVNRLLGPRPHGTVAALVQAIDEANPELLQELERAVAARRRSRDGT
jgi:predicted transcriptional regulator